MPVKPSDKEAEYFAKEEFKKLKKSEEEKRIKMEAEEKQKLKDLHYMNCPKCGMNLVEIDYKGIAQVEKSSGWIIHKEVKASFSAEFRHQGIVAPSSVDLIRIIEPVESVTSP